MATSGKEKIFNIDNLQDKSDRTLIYGCNDQKDNFHVYVKDGQVHKFIYKDIRLKDLVKVSYEKGSFDNILDLVPTGRVHPASIDIEFLTLLAKDEIRVKFMPFDIEEYERYERIENVKYHGKIYIK